MSCGWGWLDAGVSDMWCLVSLINVREMDDVCPLASCSLLCSQLNCGEPAIFAKASASPESVVGAKFPFPLFISFCHPSNHLFSFYTLR